MDLKIEEILKCTNGKLLIGDVNEYCVNFSKDTRTLIEGDTYIGIKGANFNGSLFWEEALEKGASTVIIENVDIKQDKLEKYKKENKNIILVKNAKEALENMAILKRKKYGEKLIVIGVTGSVGKTSTKDIIASVLSKKYKTLKTEGNNNNDIGVPLTILKLKDHETAVIEMGMNHLNEISKLTSIAKPTISVITNIGTSHIGNLGSRENILKAKLEILEGMEKPIIVINNDNDLLHEWGKTNKNKIEIHTFGIQNKSDCMAKDIKYGENNSNFMCKYLNEEFNLDIPVKGEHFVLNSLCATTIGKLCNLNDNEIKYGIKNFSLTKKRMEISKTENGVTIINDSYNASFESMKASIEYLASTNSKRKIAVLGDMFELGDFSEELHRKVGIEVAKNKIDILYCIGENSRYIVEEAEKNKMEKIYYFNNKGELIDNLQNTLKYDDAVLFKASNGMKLFEIVEELKNKISKK